MRTTRASDILRTGSRTNIINRVFTQSANITRITLNWCGYLSMSDNWYSRCTLTSTCLDTAIGMTGDIASASTIITITRSYATDTTTSTSNTIAKSAIALENLRLIKTCLCAVTSAGVNYIIATAKSSAIDTSAIRTTRRFPASWIRHWWA